MRGVEALRPLGAFGLALARTRVALFAAVFLAAAVAASGCASNKISLRAVPNSPLVEVLDLASWRGPKPSDQTAQLLRVYNLGDDLQGDCRPLLKKLQAISDREPSATTAYAMAELAFLGGKKTERQHDTRAAMDLYGASVLHAYEYLFDPRFCETRNPYDPQYRRACDLYNGALESALRIVCAGKELRPGATRTIHTAGGSWDVTCVLDGRNVPWRPQDFDHFEFVSDYEVKGLKNQYVTHGLGVPLIAIRRGYQGEPVAAKYYPPGLSFPVTAFMRPLSNIDPQTGQPAPRNQCVLELYDPLSVGETLVGDRRVPLESDLTTPLAYFLSRPEFDILATQGLLHPESLLAPRPQESLLALQPGRPECIMGLYMAQPYVPGKIPVLMVHGLWSSPMTWMEMFNDLRSQPEIRDRFQFWFYLYPTGQPFWQSAALLRRDLARVRDTLDPEHREPSLDQMVLIGHSMGGLVSTLQTLSGGQDYWRLVSQTPFSAIKAEPKTREKLAETFFFQPNPSIRRVVTIGTPSRGSTFSNQTTQWLLGKVIHLPERLIAGRQALFCDNPGAFGGDSLARIDTSIDSLSPSDPIFPVMLASRRPPWVTYHNIVGVVPRDSWLGKLTVEGDGVVPRASAHLDDVASEITVAADHSSLHSHPAAVLEVRRILLEHVAELEGRPIDSMALRPAIVR
ncbi:MAG: alpha/beta fold hydrolase [Thermoguttaceae bacterium]